MELCPEEDQSASIEHSEQGPGNELSMLEADKSHQGLTESGSEERTYECPGHSTREGEMIIAGRELLVDVGQWGAVDQDVVDGLDVERLFHLGIWSCQ